MKRIFPVSRGEREIQKTNLVVREEIFLNFFIFRLCNSFGRSVILQNEAFLQKIFGLDFCKISEYRLVSFKLSRPAQQK